MLRAFIQAGPALAVLRPVVTFSWLLDVDLKGILSIDARVDKLEQLLACRGAPLGTTLQNILSSPWKMLGYRGYLDPHGATEEAKQVVSEFKLSWEAGALPIERRNYLSGAQNICTEAATTAATTTTTTTAAACATAAPSTWWTPCHVLNPL